MTRLLKILVTLTVITIIIAVSFGAGVALGGSGLIFQPAAVQAADQPAEFVLFWQVWQLVQDNFIDRAVLDPTQLTYGAINGLIAALGDEGHTRFLTPEEAARQQTDISGTFFGIGATVGVRDGLPVIVAPFDGSPADQAGIKAGDIIIEVDGEDITTLPLDKIIDRIRGEKGTPVVLTLFRPDTNESLDISVVRGEINIPAATWAMIPGTNIALIRLNQFSANLNDELTQAVTAAEQAGAAQLIVDARNNPGGLLNQAVKVTSQFLKSGDVLLQENANSSREHYAVRPGGIATDIPLVVLVNRGTASSAEIFAGAIQDHQRGQIVGETTFGTGTVLQPFELEGGAALLLGTSQWLTPNGRLIRKHGIEPDVTVELSAGVNLLSPAELKNLTPAEWQASEDKQLLKAIELLDSGAVANTK